MQLYVSGEVGYWDLGTSDAFYGCTTSDVFRPASPYASYTTWNLGIGWTWKVFTVDLRYIDTDLSKGDCNAFTSDHTATLRGPPSRRSTSARLQLVRRALRRPALGRPDGQHQSEVTRLPDPVAGGGHPAAARFVYGDAPLTPPPAASALSRSR